MKVNLIDEDGQFLGSVDINEAGRRAKEQKKDLVLINPKTNTYKIADAGKLKYEQKQHEKNLRANQRSHKMKEIKVRPVIDKHDLDIKIEHIRGFLAQGHKTKVIMIIKGRQYKDLALEKFNEIPTTLINEGIATLDFPPQFNGRDIVAILSPVIK